MSGEDDNDEIFNSLLIIVDQCSVILNEVKNLLIF